MSITKIEKGKVNSGFFYFGFPITWKWHIVIRMIHVVAFLVTGMFLSFSIINFAADIIFLTMFGGGVLDFVNMQTFANLILWISIIVSIAISKFMLKGKGSEYPPSYDLMVKLITAALSITWTISVTLFILF